MMAKPMRCSADHAVRTLLSDARMCAAARGAVHAHGRPNSTKSRDIRAIACASRNRANLYSMFCIFRSAAMLGKVAVLLDAEQSLVLFLTACSIYCTSARVILLTPQRCTCILLSALRLFWRREGVLLFSTAG